MPIYEFKCTSCGHVFSRLFKSAAREPDAQCPKCDSRQVNRLFSAFSSARSSSRSGGASCGTGGFT
ncbi:MAG TPA: zinc ribbon domain-containing protein [bacterium]|nr:zinc ribbon domain-containing protein [bacterium]